MGELIVPIVMLLIGGMFYREAGLLKVKEGYAMNSASYPRFLAVILMLCAVFLIIRFVIRRKAYMENEKNMVLDPRVMLVAIMFALFYLLLDKLGYIICGIGMMVGLAMLLQKGKRNIFDTVIFPVVFTICLFFAFRFMSVYLPNGVIFKNFF